VSGPLVLAAVATAVGTWLVVAGRGPALRAPVSRARGRGDRWVPALLLGVVAGGGVVLAEGVVLALLLVLLLAAGGAWNLLARSRARRGRMLRTGRVVDFCEALVAELRAGRPAGPALVRACEGRPELRAVGRAVELGGDVPQALREVAALPGAEALRELASAWAVSARAGTTLSLSVGRVAESARRRQLLARMVAAELAAARATATLVGLLPVAVLALGQGLGGDVWGFLLTTAPGVTCLGLAVLLTHLGLRWIDRIAEGVL
jgi:tight adherence protein B